MRRVVKKNPRTKAVRTLYITDQATLEASEVQDLAAKGHTVITDIKPADALVLGRQCRMVRQETIKYVGLALKELGKVEGVIKVDSTIEEEDDDADELSNDGL